MRIAFVCFYDPERVLFVTAKLLVQFINIAGDPTIAKKRAEMWRDVPYEKEQMKTIVKQQM